MSAKSKRSLFQPLPPVSSLRLRAYVFFVPFVFFVVPPFVPFVVPPFVCFVVPSFVPFVCFVVPSFVSFVPFVFFVFFVVPWFRGSVV